MGNQIRKAISKRTRFAVFHRDGFRCQYCGRTPPATVLEIDHVLAVANGGSDAKENLTTACFDCNRGKSATDLDRVPESVVLMAERLREQEAQVKAYQQACKAVRRREDANISEIEMAFNQHYPSQAFDAEFKRSIRANFLPHFDIEEMTDDIQAACERTHNARAAQSYFCGICWRKLERRGLR